MALAGTMPFNLPILMYHHLDGSADTPYALSVGQFIAQLDALRRSGFATLTFSDLSKAMQGHRECPGKPVLLTFDDGYESFRELAVPALAGRGMKATVFVVAGEIGGFNRWDVETGIPRRALMPEQGIREVIAAGMEVGSHGWAHRDLTACSDAELDEEIGWSRQELQRRFGVEVGAFAYPYGRHGARLFPRLVQAGYHCAASIFSNAKTVTENPFAMRRVYVHPGDTPLRFRYKLSPLYLRYVARRDRNKTFETFKKS